HQLDADRLDFLVRDRYFTGIRSAAIDLEWLFDSLRILKIPIELGSSIKEFTFVVGEKGLAVAEEYLFAYTKMYTNVYFHKTTRAVQLMVTEILISIFKNKSFLRKIPDENLLKSYFCSNKQPNLDVYLKLDDASVINFLRIISSGKFSEATVLARRFFDRDLFKCFEVSRSTSDDFPRKKFGDFLDELDRKKIKVIRDITPEKGLKQYDIIGEKFLNNLLVIDQNEYKPIAKLSRPIREMTSVRTIRLYFKTATDRTRALQIWNSL
ncbi:MAG: hypothetical protein O7D27_10405, partial [Alphaproteobacteria bacterium]|nr:hypothetical protein [Alphaproteobacteria bacterium]